MSNEKKVRAPAPLNEHEKRRQDEDDLKFILSTPQGRRFLWRYLGVCGVYKLSFTSDALVTAFNEGRRNVGLQLSQESAVASPESYFQMMKEGT